MNKFLKTFCLSFIMVWFVLICNRLEVSAAEVEVTFGSESYEQDNEKEFPLGVYLNATEALGYYRVEIAYDASRMQYIDGASEANNGLLVITGNSAEKSTKHMLHFKSVKAGQTTISIADAVVKASSEENAETYQVTKKAQAPIVIKGEAEDAEEVDQNAEEETEEVTEEAEADENGADATEAADEEAEAESEEDAVLAETETGLEDDSQTVEIPIIDTVSASGGGKYSIVDHSVYVPEDADWQYYLLEGTYKGKTITYLCDNNDIARILYLMDKDGNFVPYAFSEDGERMSQCVKVVYRDTEYLQLASSVTKLPKGLTAEMIEEEGIVCFLNKSGSCYFYKQSESGTLVPWNYGANTIKTQTIPLPLALGVIGVLAAVIVISIAFTLIRMQRDKKRVSHEEHKSQYYFEFDEI